MERRHNRGAIPTVRIQVNTKSGFVVINESDFDKRIQKLYKESEIKEPVVIVEPVVEEVVEQEPEVEEKEPAITRLKKVKGVK